MAVSASSSFGLLSQPELKLLKVGLRVRVGVWLRTPSPDPTTSSSQLVLCTLPNLLLTQCLHRQPDSEPQARPGCGVTVSRPKASWRRPGPAGGPEMLSQRLRTGTVTGTGSLSRTDATHFPRTYLFKLTTILARRGAPAASPVPAKGPTGMFVHDGARGPGPGSNRAEAAGVCWRSSEAGMVLEDAARGGSCQCLWITWGCVAPRTPNRGTRGARSTARRRAYFKSTKIGSS